jgi:hypothetical protein
VATVRYQVFVSSTFRDLVSARRAVAQALQTMDCIPAGMELFPASNDEQFGVIKRAIDESDYYVVIVAGRYGSTDEAGISYTEREFDYAVEKGIPILAFVHANPDAISVGLSDIAPESRASLERFRNKVMAGRLVKMWANENELGANVVLAVMAARQTHPSPGWVRGPGSDTTDLLRQINELRQDNDGLRQQLASAPKPQPIRDLAGGDELFFLSGRRQVGSGKVTWQAELTWDRMLFHIGPDLLKQWSHDVAVNKSLAKGALRDLEKPQTGGDVDEEVFDTVRLQFMASGFVEIKSLQTIAKTTALYWTLTPTGIARLMSLRTVKSQQPSSKP